MSAPEQIDSVLARFAPVGAAIVLIVLFTALGFWQLDRAAQKAELERLFDDDADTVTLTDGLQPREFQRLDARGRYLPERQFLIDNIVRDRRLGYYVITPFETARREPLLLVNRGWLARPDGGEKPGLAVSADYGAIRGRAGRLPRVGIRPGEALLPGDDWPKVAVYPTGEELAAALGAELRSFVLLLDAGEPSGFLRDWQPREAGPMRHYGYAFQWFALAVTVAGILGWRFLRRPRRAP